MKRFGRGFQKIRFGSALLSEAGGERSLPQSQVKPSRLTEKRTQLHESEEHHVV
jgi:hypothetical protein